MKISAIIVAAGSSRRMGFDKLEADLDGESVLTRSLLVFQACPEVGEIWVVTNPEKFDAIEATAARLEINRFAGTIEGGAERHLSVSAGLERVGDDFDLVAVHDGARPLVSAAAIARCANEASRVGAATLAHRVADTLKRGNDDLEVCGAVSRENLWAMETPQIFQRELLRKAYAKVLADGEIVTDEVSAMEAIGVSVSLVENTEPNLKITVPGDLVVAAAILRGGAESFPTVA
ncbi:MAG: 2-C-methyl-D-erythritol 4-phosphate cytidylyltransferase [Verrucomicrobiales bacterium]|nr:2-C-methyl-D-erythritol 4-phosphate cytidylyltransferase [Verrucomicrobiales bacterium]